MISVLGTPNNLVTSSLQPSNQTNCIFTLQLGILCLASFSQQEVEERMCRHVGKWAPVPQRKRGTVQSMGNDRRTATGTQGKRRACSLAWGNQLYFVPKDAGVAFLKGNFKMHVFTRRKLPLSSLQTRNTFKNSKIDKSF